MKSKLLLLVLALLVIQCSSKKDNSVLKTTRVFEVVEEFRIDNPEDIDEFYFASVSHIAIGKGGNIFWVMLNYQRSVCLMKMVLS